LILNFQFALFASVRSWSLFSKDEAANRMKDLIGGSGWKIGMLREIP